MELQVNVVVPDPVTVAGKNEPQVRPAGTVSVNATLPENPFSAVIVIVDTADAPALTAAGEEDAMVKSTKLKLAVVECVIAGVVLVPIIVRVKMPAVVELHDTVPVPEPATLLGVIAAQVRPDGTASVNDTVAVNPFWAVTVIVEVADWPAFTALGEVAEMVKSWAALNVKPAFELWESDPLVPVTMTVKVPVVVDEQESVAVPEPVKLLGVIAPHVSPTGTVSVSATTPENPLTPVKVIVDVALAPTVADAALAVIVKSWKLNVAVVE